MSQGGGNSNAYQSAADALTGAGAATNSALGMYQNMPTIASGMSTYQNPFTENVINRSMDSMNRMTQQQQQTNAANAARAGAFGGARHGLVEAETNAAAQRNMGDLAANLQMQGFNTAANLAGQDIANRFNAAGGLLSGAGTLGNLGSTAFNAANTLQQQQWQQGLFAQNMRDRQLGDARSMFEGFTGAPQNSVNLMAQILGGSPLGRNSSTTSQYQPGILDILSLGLGIAAL